jgi:molybdate transport system substrate-binding protein
MTLRVISAGAAKGLIQDLEGPLCQVLSPSSPLQLQCSFGAVGAMKDIFLSEIKATLPSNWAGVVMVSSQSILTSLVQESLLEPSSLKPMGWVSTAMARLEGDHRIQAMHEESDLREALLKSPVIYAPDTEKSTAGIHFKKVLNDLSLWPAVKDRVQNFPNGAAAMGQMAKDQIQGALGCTQVTEINYTPGVEVISHLPKRFELNTLYSAARAKQGADISLADAFIEWVGGENVVPKKARLEGGFFDL